MWRRVNMKVNVAVSGKFHYHNYVRYLDSKGILNRFYYAHKLSTDADELGVSKNKLVNIWIKEYLLQAHSQYMPRLGSESMKPFYRWLWGIGSLARWSPCDVLHIMLHGGGIGLIRRAKSEGSFVLGEPVNAHPDLQNDILNAEWERLKIRRFQGRSHAQQQMLKEIAMADRLLVASNFLKRSYAEKGFPAGSIDVLPYGVNLVRFGRSNAVREGMDRFRVICVAGINVRKGIVDLLEAWKILNLPDGELLLVGRVSPEMLSVMREYEGSFRHIPFVPNTELKGYLQASTVFVLPSLEDGFGLVCAEAMACGLPVIATMNTGAAELIEENVTGHVVPIRSPEIIAEKLEALYRDQDRARSMGNAAADKVESLYGWDGYTSKLIEIYEAGLAQAG